jgi:ribonuclease HI
MDKRTTNSKTVLNCRNNLKILQNHNPITLNWIKAHNNHPGNELADFLAKKGTNPTPPTLGPLQNTLPKIVYTPFPKPHIRNIINTAFDKK